MATNLTRIQSDNDIKRGSSPTASEARGWKNLVRISDFKSAHNASWVEGGFYLFFFLQRGFICRILKPFSPRIPRLLGNMVVTEFIGFPQNTPPSHYTGPSSPQAFINPVFTSNVYTARQVSFERTSTAENISCLEGNDFVNRKGRYSLWHGKRHFTRKLPK